ncbi:hypothetical protein I4U23_005418 [Adineta vaga]|nr:hypothetical protein I4U23_005418 [Adineta vaga]
MSNDTVDKRQHFDVLRNIENWLKVLTNPKNLNTTMKLFEDEDIKEIGDCFSENLKKIFAVLMPTKRAQLLIITFTRLIHIYDADQNEYITSQPAFLSVTKTIVNDISNLMNPDEYADYHTEILNLLFKTFAKDNFLIHCLQEFFPNKPISTTNPDVNNKQRSQTTFDDIKDCLLQLIELAYDPREITTLQSAEDFSHNYRSLIEWLLAYTDEFLNCYDEHVDSESQLDNIDNIFGIIINLADIISLVPMFIDAKYAETTVKWLIQPSLLDFIYQFGESIMRLIYNLSRHKKGLKKLREIGTFKILMEHKELIKKTGNPDLIESFGMLLIALARNDDEEKQNEDVILPVSANLFESIKKAFSSEDWRHDGCHLSEYLYSLQGAFSNKTIVQHILGDSNHVKKDNIQIFIELFRSNYGLLFNQDVNDLEKLVVKSLLNIILCISNYKEYRSVLTDDVFLGVIIESLSKQPRQAVAKRIWSNLNHSENSKSFLNKLKKDKTTEIYISYNWTDGEYCRKFVKSLREQRKFSIWVDYEETDENEDPWDYVAPVIESATVIIILASSAYAYSKHNRQELNYAMRSELSGEKKNFIAVNIEPTFHFDPLRINDSLTVDEILSNGDSIETLALKTAVHIDLLKFVKPPPSLSSVTSTELINQNLYIFNYGIYKLLPLGIDPTPTQKIMGYELSCS